MGGPSVVARVVAAAGDAPLCARRLGDLYQAELARHRDRRRAAGSFYTPPHLIDLILSRVLDPILEERGAEALWRVRLIDPACGVGAFLEAALERLEAAHVAAGARPGPALRGAIARRCLVGLDIDPGAVALCRLALEAAVGAPADLSVVVRRGDALLDEVGERFDAVVGNPPWGQKHVRFTDAAKAALRRRYTTARGVLDPFKLFVERAHQLAAPGGRWGLALPDIVLLKNQEPVRALMLERSSLDVIAHAGRAFPGVNLDAVVIAGRVAAPPPGHRVEMWHRVPEDWRAAPPPRRERRQEVFARLPGKKLNLFASDAALELVERLRPLPRLGDRFEIHEGVHSGNCRARLFRCAPAAPGAKLVVGGRDVARFRLRWSGRYLDLDPATVDRAAGDYASRGRPSWHAAKKIVVRRTGDHVVAALDRRGLWVSNNLFVVLPRSVMTEAELAAHVALLNSGLLTWYFRTIQPRVGRLFAELKIEHLSDFPLPPPERWGHRAIAELAELAAALEASGAEASDELDERVLALYGVRPEELE